MLIKYGDRLTLDFALACREYFNTGKLQAAQRILEFTRANESRRGELPFPEKVEDAVRVFIYDDAKTRRQVSLAEFHGLFQGDVKAISPVAGLSADPESLEKLLSGETARSLAFDDRPLIYLYLHQRLVYVAEGSTGRKYARDKAEIFEYLRRIPNLSGLFFDIVAMTGYREVIESLSDLEAFVDRNAEWGLDFLIDRLSMLQMVSDQPQILELNPNARASFDIVCGLVEANYKPVLTPLASAKANLARSLRELLTYAATAGLLPQATAFRIGLDILEGDREPKLPDFWNPPLRNSEQGRLFGAAITADDFAGMASWNDVQIEQDLAYRRVSNAVVLSILESVCSAAN